MLMNENSRIYVAGHRGLVGSAIWRELQRQGFGNLIGRTRQEVNLLDADAVKKILCRDETGVCVHRVRQGRRHLRQRHAARVVSV